MPLPSVIIVGVIQGGGPRRPSPGRHNELGRLDVKELQLQQREGIIIYPLYIEGGKQGEKHINNPHVQGARTQDIQHDAGHPKQFNNPPSPHIITPPHKRVVVPEHVTYPDQNEKHPETKIRPPTHQHNPVCQSTCECPCHL